MQKAHPQKRGCAFLYLFRVRALNHASWIWRKADIRPNKKIVCFFNFSNK